MGDNPPGKRTPKIGSLLAGGVGLAAGTIIPTGFNELHRVYDVYTHREEREQDQRQHLTEREQDFVMRIMELQKTNDGKQGQNVVVLTSLIARHYLTEPFATDFVEAIATMGVAAGSPAPQSPEAAAQSAKAAADGTAPGLRAATDLRETENAAAVRDTLDKQGASKDIPELVKATLQPGQGRVYFQVAEVGDKAASAQFRERLSKETDIGQEWKLDGDEVVTTFLGPTQVRYFYPQDRDEADRFAHIMAKFYDGVKCQRIGGYDTTGKVKPRLFEVWLAPKVRPSEAPKASVGEQKICA